MLDIKWICDHPALFDQGLINRGHSPLSEQIIAMDKAYRQVQTTLQNLQKQRNDLSALIGQAHKHQDPQKIIELTTAVAQVKFDLGVAEQQEQSLADQLNDLVTSLPNIAMSDVPIGNDESGNQEVLRWGNIPVFDFQPQPHEIIGEALGYIDTQAATAMSGSRFTVLTGQLAYLERALANFMIDVHTTEFGYTEVSPPLLVKDNAFYGVGLLPKFADNAFQTTTGHWLIPTAEVSLTNLVANQILDAKDLPLRFVAHTPCFRSEAGAAGRDTRGMIRQHQFYKVELVSVVDPEFEVEEHERMTQCAQTILEYLELPYRKMLLCTGDMGLQSKKTFDLEVWIPSQNTYREISSCSICGDYQARRMKTRFKRSDAKSKNHFVSTLNGSGLAIGRTIVAILENFQLKDGSVKIPTMLRSYMNNQEFIEMVKK